MGKRNLLNRLKDWLTFGRIVPIITASVALIANLLNVLGILNFSLAENILLLIVGLLAIDSLTERVDVLAKISAALNRIESPKSNIDEITIPASSLPPLEERLKNVQTLWVSGIAIPELLAASESVLSTLMSEKKLKVRLLISPLESPFIQELANINYPNEKISLERLQKNIERTNIIIQGLMEKAPLGFLEVKVLHNFPLQSLFITDANTPESEVQVFLFVHQGKPPGVFRIKNSPTAKWHPLFEQEFRYLWERASTFPAKK